MDEADVHPTGDEGGLPVADGVEEGEVGVRGGGECGIVTEDRVVGELFDFGVIAARREELESADADVAGSDAGEDGTGQGTLAENRLTGGDGGEGAGGGDAKCVHCLAHQILAQDRAEGGFAVAATGKRRTTGALELDVAAMALGIDQLAKEQGATVAELRNKVAELMTGVGLGEHFSVWGGEVAREDIDGSLGVESVEAKFGG